ncbi:hypothetical protein EUTSA_v100282641mg, partial [Eutrema salsugineum]|jgi:hypothetical protein
MTE